LESDKQTLQRYLGITGEKKGAFYLVKWRVINHISYQT